MRGKLVEHEDALDEALLSNAFAWMHKAADDRLDGMVALLQKVGASVRLPKGMRLFSLWWPRRQRWSCFCPLCLILQPLYSSLASHA